MKKALSLSLMASMASGCHHTARLTAVPEIHYETKYAADTFVRRDSILRHSETIVREADSAELEKYGIRPDAMQRTWLIRERTQEREISQQKSEHRDTVVRKDSIRVPYPVEVEVPAKLTRWQSLRLCMGNGFLFTVACALLYCILRRIIKKIV